MNTLYFSAAGALAAIWLIVHLFLGGRQIAGPFMNATALDPIIRHMQYLCWHFTSVAIACMAAFFAWTVLSGDPALATAGTVLASGFFLVGVGLVVLMKENHFTLPQGWLFLPVAVLGILGHIA